jgi:hypothetical protein
VRHRDPAISGLAVTTKRLDHVTLATDSWHHSQPTLLTQDEERTREVLMSPSALASSQSFFAYNTPENHPDG